MRQNEFCVPQVIGVPYSQKGPYWWESPTTLAEGAGIFDELMIPVGMALLQLLSIKAGM